LRLALKLAEGDTLSVPKMFADDPYLINNMPTLQLLAATTTLFFSMFNTSSEKSLPETR
jgi:hypothetical protein